MTEGREPRGAGWGGRSLRLKVLPSSRDHGEPLFFFSSGSCCHSLCVVNILGEDRAAGLSIGGTRSRTAGPVSWGPVAGVQAIQPLISTAALSAAYEADMIDARCFAVLSR
jgi:hypothetical protein